MSHINLDTLYRQVIMDHYKHPRNRGTFDDDSLTVEMNNPTCGDRIFLQFKLDGDIVKDVKFTGEGCSISLASASMMTQAIKGKKIEESIKLSKLFSDMMLGKEVDIDEFGLEDIEALQGVSNFPARIKCATLAWKAMEKVNKE
ncbi:Fe-S cluster assembly sulfur transfer protein SufU [Pseudogracilibacillus auburnensis]|uniref:Nitrogen fixation NifU-like protein n=1 Tax=Pseudogracilibacillus auburnensis TaxID=1494959 RepID=A0A2V3VN56_9BACI|nr:SUF system NifU family Fe-S cluster assembly protein [Pseudogracilibacillus auburnensis]MBO1004976.1 SUF system NifU family Fe-S cluster assembly protein [Pseudogracilibacillus auburnensis]PXW81455.1 nitrogen fixation NifU-like protein [Pseudogracilibacillus auburnensis]